MVDAVDLSASSYNNPKEFYNKYKTISNSIYTANIDNIRVYAIDTKDYIAISFRGTKNSSNIKTDLDIKPTLFLDIPDTQVHRGFYDVALKSKEIFKDLLKKDKPIFITGHSLGGAISTLLGAILHKEDYTVSIYTFGSPAVGNKVFLDNIKGLKYYRYIHKFDLVAKLDKTFVKTIQNSLLFVKQFIDSSSGQQNIVLDTLEDLVKNINYNYVYDDYKTIILTQTIDSSINILNIPPLLNFLATPILYHNVEIYKKILIHF